MTYIMTYIMTYNKYALASIIIIKPSLRCFLALIIGMLAIRDRSNH